MVKEVSIEHRTLEYGSEDEFENMSANGNTKDIGGKKLKKNPTTVGLFKRAYCKVPDGDDSIDSETATMGLPKHSYLLTYLQDLSHNSIKLGALLALALINAMAMTATRYSRIRTDKMYIPTVAVLMNEALKMIVSISLLYLSEKSRFKSSLYHHFVEDFTGTAKVAVISLIYVIQNTLFYVGNSHLDGAVFQGFRAGPAERLIIIAEDSRALIWVLNQSKIFFTVILAKFILGQSFKQSQYGAITALIAGIILVQTAQVKSGAVRKATGEESKLIGSLACITSAFLSGVAGIFFEKVLKKTPHVSLWMRQVQLASLSLPIAFLQCWTYDIHEILEKGFFYGFDSFVWFVVTVQALGGLTIALVIKYADNIVKIFATSMAIVLTSILSVVLFETVFGLQMMCGTAIVLASVIAYTL
ncbi:unnamed protein product [Cyprideis torosa]|uniref:Uncharacterized protein n=1 Tax=Cyprideis torosa TaxID=163714 RepID=A0A7R8ZM81_9CRUS|nr:unnamed protein product [Cyprideis torosa]CAG0893603.1 unnamed protein product [Cyprideis torosa]